MLAISFIVGQLNSPIQQFITFIRDLQDAKISLERLGEIHNKKDEDAIDSRSVTNIDLTSNLVLNNISYRYTGTQEFVLKKLNLQIPSKKITAIVGVSGSGKTTLMKLLLKFYNPNKGQIRIGDNDLKNISNKKWMDLCGVVMQEGYIFSDTIERNIATCDKEIDDVKLKYSLETANLEDFVNDLPNGLNTKIGSSGNGISGGQKQRILIARAVYKYPEILFFDEATSALDANNEKTIMENLNRLFENKTVVVIAHRLSTVKNADQIVVLDSGKIIETGSHTDLIKKRGNYYRLVKDQLELGN